MPSPKAQRNGVVPKGTVAEKSLSFHGKAAPPEQSLRRPRTMPDLRSTPMTCGFPASFPAPERKLTPTKVLFNVAIQESVGTVQVLLNPESRVSDLICGALKQYVKERRRPVFSSSDADEFDLHYSQFSLESLDRDEKLAALGSRNFFMCKRPEVVEGGTGSNDGASTSSCSTQAEKVKLGSPFPWLKFILRAGGGH